MKKGIFVTGRVLKAIGKVATSDRSILRYSGLYVIRDDLGTYALATNGLALAAYRIGAGGKPAGGRFEYNDIQILSAGERYEVKLTSRAVFINSPNVSIMASDDARDMDHWRQAFEKPIEDGARHLGIPAWQDIRKVCDVIAAIERSEAVDGVVIEPQVCNGRYSGRVVYVTGATLTRNGKHIPLDEELVCIASARHPTKVGCVFPDWAEV